MITLQEFGVPEFLTAIGMVAAFIMIGIVRDKKSNVSKKEKSGKEDV